MATIKNSINVSGGVIPFMVIVVYKSTAPTAEVDRIVYENGVNPNPFQFVFTDLVNGTYYVVVHESVDGISLGNIRHDYWIDAATNTILFERYFFRVGEEGAPSAGESVFTDLSLNGVTITGVFKEGFRYLRDNVEWQPYSGGPGWELLAGQSFSIDEVWSYEVSRTIATSAPSPNDAFAEVVAVSGDITLDSSHLNKTILVNSALNKVTVTLQNAASVPDGKGYIIRHDRGNAINVVIKAFNTNIIRFRGTDKNSVVEGIGEVVKLIKYTDDGQPKWCVQDEHGHWERVGEYVGWHSQVRDNHIPLLGGEYDPVTYVRLAEFVDSLEPTLVKTYAEFNSTTTINGEVVYHKRGFFAKDAGTGKIRVPDLAGKYMRYLKNVGGADASRIDNIPGGYQHWAVGEHDHNLPRDGGGLEDLQSVVNSANSDEAISGLSKTGKHNTGGENIVKNIGLIPLLCI